MYLDVFSSFKIPLNNDDDDDDYKEGGCLRATERIEGETSLPSCLPFITASRNESERGEREKESMTFSPQFVGRSVAPRPPSLARALICHSVVRLSVRPMATERRVKWRSLRSLRIRLAKMPLYSVRIMTTF